MIRKLLISAAILAALIYGKETNTADARSLAHGVSSPATMSNQVAENHDAARHDGAGAMSGSAAYTKF